MLKNKLVSTGFGVLLLLSVGGTAFADEPTVSTSYSKEQLADIQKGKAETQILKQELESGNAESNVVPDKKGSKIQNNLSSVSTLTSSSTPASSRKGTFYVTSDATSSNSSAWAGGHAAMVYSQYYTIEAWGNQGDALNGVNLWPNNWKTKYNHFEALSLYNTTLSEDQEAGDKAFSYAGWVPYNYNFFNIDQDNSFYCSQLVWYAFEHTAGIDLNDGGAVWPVDLTQSSETYSFYAQ